VDGASVAATDAPSTALVDAPARTPSADAGHPPEDDLESGADPEPTPTSAEEPTVSIPAGWDLPGQGASDEATVSIPAPHDRGAQPVDEATETVEDSSGDSADDEGPGSAHRNKTAQ